MRLPICPQPNKYSPHLPEKLRNSNAEERGQNGNIINCKTLTAISKKSGAIRGEVEKSGRSACFNC